jgi:hydroxylamine reductase (hybrid-cluster protein)
MATTEQIIEHLRKLSAYKERPECDSDGIPHYIDSGNTNDAYGIGETDGGINLAKELIDALDNGAPLPDLPALDYEDEDEE